MNTLTKRLSTFGVFAILVLTSAFARADSGWFLGGSAGTASFEVDFEEQVDNASNFDEDDFAWKVFGGYIIDIPFINLGVEAGYVDLGNPEGRITSGTRVKLDADGFNLWGTAGLDFGPFGVFAKYGVIAWDVGGRSFGELSESISDSGTDMGYGIGAKFQLFSLQFRGEWEVYDIAEVEDVSMLSIGVAWIF